MQMCMYACIVCVNVCSVQCVHVCGLHIHMVCVHVCEWMGDIEWLFHGIKEN